MGRTAKKTVTVEELATGDIYEKETPPALPIEVTPPVTESVTKPPEDTKPAMVQLRLTAMYIRADTREFRQNSAELQPSGWGVAVDVPNTPEMFAAENMLTPAGLVYLQKQLEQPYQDWTYQLTKNKAATSEDAEDVPWEEDEKKETTKAPETKASDDEWGDESKSSGSDNKKTEEKWDEEKDEDWK